MPQDEIKWTSQQKRAIDARGSDVLVTASAGTGKTAVLSGRCVSFVSDAGVCPDVMSLLVLTFTDAAAEQMRSRIAGQLKSEIERTGERRLVHQLVLLQGADISTIHSFCKRIITEHFFQLGLDPTFSVIDADEAKLLKTEILQKTIDWAWQQSDLTEGLRNLFRRREVRSESGFLDTIVQLSEFLDTLASRDNWYARAEQLSCTADLAASDLATVQKEHIAECLDAILARLYHAKSIYEGKVPAGPWAQKFDETHIAPVEACVKALEDDKWDAVVEGIRGFAPTTRKPKDVDEPLDEIIRDTAKKAVDQFKGLKRFAIINPEYLDLIGESGSQQMQVMIELVRKFDQLYKQAKRDANCLDFSDLEHLALKLLAGDQCGGEKPSPTRTALDLRRRYKYIFVDEYQDINPVQQTILDMLSSGDNVFVVGDVKQSIYAWRGARPDIFLQRLESGPDSATASLRVDLNTNFRSAKPVLDFVNTLFARTMTKSFCGTDYDESAHLRPPEDKTDEAVSCESATAVEFYVLDEVSKDKDKEEDGQDSSDAGEGDDIGLVDSHQRQAAFIAERIRRLVGVDTGRAEMQVYDKRQGCHREVEYRDIVVLMRSLASRANDYVQILRLAGIPVSCQTSSGYFEKTEITDMLSLLKVLDNPIRDIELAAVLRSPIFGVTDSELARIQICSDGGPRSSGFFGRVRSCAESCSDSALSNKLSDALALIDRWRTLARRGSLADLIWDVYRRTNYLSFVSALPEGRTRRANLLKLHDRAIQFEGFASSPGIPSLTRFVEFIEKLQESGQDWAPAEPESAAGNAVRILSVHKSKGLEFPVVFLAELQTKFNKRDATADVLADPDYALGLQVIDAGSNTKLKSLAHQVIAERKTAVSLAEEMRILYVAATRAKDRLILTASEKKDRCRQIVTGGYYFGDDPLPDWQLRGCSRPLEWVLNSLSNQKAIHAGLDTGLEDRVQDSSLFTFELLSQDRLAELSKSVEQQRRLRLSRSQSDQRKKQPKAAKSPLFARIKQSLAWRYHFGSVPRLPAKTSVTDLTHRSDEFARLDYSGALTRQPGVLASQKPGTTGAISPTLIGSAAHLVISELDLAGPMDSRKIEHTVNDLLDRGAINAEIAGNIDSISIMAFFDTDLGRRALDSNNNVLREWPFTFSLPAADYPGLQIEPQAADEVIVVQGIIDMLVRTPDGLVIIDFKTDNVTVSEVAKRAELYRPQLDLYARAASVITESAIAGKALYFLRPQQIVQWQ